MTQAQRLDVLLEYFIADGPDPATAPPAKAAEKQALLRGLMNIRPPRPVPANILAVQDGYLAALREEKGVVHLEGLTPFAPGANTSGNNRNIYLWQGDITRLAVDAIANAANSALLGCFIPGHHCIDNAIHSAAGVQLRQACADIMAQQGAPEATGKAKLTPGFNLPAKHVLHTVGPIVRSGLTDTHRAQLAACYQSCLALADAHGLASVAFCCISTGEFHFPPHRAAEIAIASVRGYLRKTGSGMKVIFNVFHDDDFRMYQYLLSEEG